MTSDLLRVKEAFYSTHHLFEVFEGQEETLLNALIRLLPEIPASEWKERLDFGGVFINGLSRFEDASLTPPFKLEYYEPRYPISEAHLHYASFSQDLIVWEDDWFILASKPNRLPTMPTKEQRRHNLKRYMDSYCNKNLHFPSRLDTSTQGLVIASKKVEAHGLLQSLFEKRQIQKTYVFASVNALDRDLEVSEPIGKDPAHPVLRKVHGIESKAAVTRFSALREGKTRLRDNSEMKCYLMEAKPITGRTHQIRVHASHIGVPIIGDNFYGGEHAHSLHLVSFSLKFRHPITEKDIYLKIPDSLLPAWLHE